MRALLRVSTPLAFLLFSAVTAARPAPTAARGAKENAPRRARLAPPAEVPRRRSAAEASGAAICERYGEQLGNGGNSVVMRTHRIVRGDSLSGIAVQYGTSVRALAAANGLKSDDVIRTGQDLVIPEQARPGGGSDWIKFAHKPERPGQLDLVGYNAHFRGQVMEKGHLSAAARTEVSEILGVHGSRPPVPERLIRLLVRVSDTFGGRPIRVVSGYRTSSFFSDSRHKQSAAVDFSIPGIPNSVVREYLLLFDNAGVGYYPNSSFVHLDVRGCAMQWVDYAGPGEAPRLRPDAPRFAGVGTGKEHNGVRKVGGGPSVADLDEIAEGVAAAMDEAALPSAKTSRDVKERDGDEPSGADATDPAGDSNGNAEDPAPRRPPRLDDTSPP
ncbi:MAG TPA: LysM peptidoglycan-binding domain-containing protein [Polyangiaceae bacterium]|nr:LysM peptidoglycan-binding domain-containing protein [Polyangiaceae bacterium]